MTRAEVYTPLPLELTCGFPICIQMVFTKSAVFFCNVLSVVQAVLLHGHPLITSFLNGAPPSKEDPESAAVSLSPHLLTDPIVFSS